MKKVLISVSLAGFIKKFLMDEIYFFQKNGYEIHVASNKNHKGAEGIEEFFKTNKVIFHQVDFSSHNPISFSSVKSYNQLKKIFKNYEFDIVHVHMAVSGVITRMAYRSKFKKGYKIFYTTHGFAFGNKRNLKEELFYLFEKISSKYCTEIITINLEDYQLANSFETCKVAMMHGIGIDYSKLNVNNFDIIEYKKNNNLPLEKKILLSVGELSARKNHIQVLKAINDCKNKNNICYCIAGIDLLSSGTKQKLEKYAQDNNIDLRLLGYRFDISYLNRIADLGILPSKKEGLGFSGLESIYCGLQLIGAKTAGIMDYINDSNGRLFDLNNTQELSKLIDYMLEHPINVNASSILIYSRENSNLEFENIMKEYI